MSVNRLFGGSMLGKGSSRIYNLVSIIFVVLSLIVIILVIARLLGPA